MTNDCLLELPTNTCGKSHCEELHKFAAHTLPLCVGGCDSPGCFVSVGGAVAVGGDLVCGGCRLLGLEGDGI